METPDTWYMDDLNLVLKMCQDVKAEADDQGRILDECCACDEAKYEVTFEGLWSRNTHPKVCERVPCGTIERAMTCNGFTSHNL